jgi:hypothetical protein
MLYNVFFFFFFFSPVEIKVISQIEITKQDYPKGIFYLLDTRPFYQQGFQ